MNFDAWMKKAREEGRVCPTCKKPVSKKAWEHMNKTGVTTDCFDCTYGHWASDPFRRLGAGGSARRDNADREDLGRMRGSS